MLGTVLCALPPDRAEAREARQAAMSTSRAQAGPARATSRSGVARPATQPRHAAGTRTATRQPTANRTATPAAARPGIVNALARGARFEGVGATLMVAMAAQESSLITTARARESSATGLMQFTRDAWLEAVRDHGAAYGLARHARAVETDQDGSVTVKDAQRLNRILALRRDPTLSVVLAAERMARARSNLATWTGREPRPADLYLVHLLGSTGARRFLVALAQRPEQSSAEVAPAAVAANRGLFMTGGRARSVGEAYAEVTRRLDSQLAVHAELLLAVQRAVRATPVRRAG